MNRRRVHRTWRGERVNPRRADAGVCALREHRSSSKQSRTVDPDDVLLSDLIAMGAAKLPRIKFCCWSKPNVSWDHWLAELVRENEVVDKWRSAGIEVAILCSLVNIKPDEGAMTALFSFWNSSTCTFMFPWGEAGFTLEDAHVLGNLPLLGSRLDEAMTAEEEELCARLEAEMEKIKHCHPKLCAKANSWSRKVTLKIWMEWFLELRSDLELYHLGFLAYWLTKNVIPPNPSGEISRRVFPLAARLCNGGRISLAPIVTANIYDDLSRISMLARKRDESKRGGNKHDVWSPFGLLQAWIWERFEALQPLRTHHVSWSSGARISQWDNEKSRTNYGTAILTFKDEKSYTWRPYSTNSGSWKEPSWYNKKPQQIRLEERLPDFINEFLLIISCSTVQGFYGDNRVTSERYKPHRVGRQFGYDQGPLSSNGQTSFWVGNIACQTGGHLLIPEISRCGFPRNDYKKWWKNFQLSFKKAADMYKVQIGGCRLERCQQIAETPLKDPGVNCETDQITAFQEGNVNLESLAKDHGLSPVMTAKSPQNKANGCNPANKANGCNIKISEKSHDKMHLDCSKKRRLDVNEPDVKRKRRTIPPEDVIEVDNESDTENVRLVDELNDFLRRGLLIDWGRRSPELEMKENNEDPFGRDAIRLYYRFFQLIPQKPHYKGLLKGNEPEGEQEAICLAQWFMLVNLMEKAMETSCQTPSSEVENLMMRARKLEEYGFDVRHIIARLKEPRAQIRRLEKASAKLEEAKIKFEEAKRKEQRSREIKNLKGEVDELRKKLRTIEKKLEENRGLTDLAQNDTLDTVALGNEVEAAEANLQAIIQRNHHSI